MSNAAIGAWREQYARQMLRLDFEPLPGAVFEARVDMLVPGLAVVDNTFCAGHTFRDKALVADGDDSFAFIISRSRRIDISHRRDIAIRANEGALLRVCHEGSLGAPATHRYLAVMVPAKELLLRCLAAEDLTSVPIQRGSEPMALLRSYLASLGSHRRNLAADCMHLVQNHIFDLLSLSLEQTKRLGDTQMGAVAAARLEAVMICISLRFKEPHLSAEAIAREQGISPRYLHRLLEAQNTSFTEEVNARRVALARRLLLDPELRAWSIADIALACGFSDISYFNRLFKSIVGITPTSLRRARDS